MEQAVNTTDGANGSIISEVHVIPTTSDIIHSVSFNGTNFGLDSTLVTVRYGDFMCEVQADTFTNEGLHCVLTTAEIPGPHVFHNFISFVFLLQSF